MREYVCFYRSAYMIFRHIFWVCSAKTNSHDAKARCRDANITNVPRRERVFLRNENMRCCSVTTSCRSVNTRFLCAETHLSGANTRLFASRSRVLFSQCEDAFSPPPSRKENVLATRTRVWATRKRGFAIRTPDSRRERAFLFRGD